MFSKTGCELIKRDLLPIINKKENILSNIIVSLHLDRYIVTEE